jgi:hypothetical protein
MPKKTAPRRALLSVSDKDGIVEFARVLLDAGYEIISTGGTQKVRGLLCHDCNRAIGLLRESEANMNRAIAYLKENRL